MTCEDVFRTQTYLKHERIKNALQYGLQYIFPLKFSSRKFDWFPNTTENCLHKDVR